MPADKPQQPTAGPHKLKRGENLQGLACFTYIPSRRSRHHADTFSRALFLAKKLGAHYGAQFCWDMAPYLADLIPLGEADMIACPPPGRVSRARGFYLARELTAAVAQITGLQLCRSLRWQQEGAEAAKHVMTQQGQGRKLGRVAECLEDLTGKPGKPGKRIILCDDLWTTGCTAEVTARAIEAAGGTVQGAYCLATTERTEKRPDNERAHLLRKRRQRAARGGAWCRPAR